MGTEHQSRLAFHIDHGVAVLSANTALVAHLSPDSDDLSGYDTGTREGIMQAARDFDAYAAALEKLGYIVRRIEHSSEDCVRSRFSMNMNVYRNLTMSAQTAMFPVYPGEYVADATAPLTEANLRGKALETYRAIRDAGGVPIPIRDPMNRHNPLRGSIHCITQILAEREVSEKVLPA